MGGALDLREVELNIGSGRQTSVRGLVKAVLEVTGTEGDVIYNPKTTPGVSLMCADLTLAGQKLNYKPSISLEDGLRLTLQRDPRLRG